VRETVGIAAPVVIAAGTAEDRGEALEAMGNGTMLFTEEAVHGRQSRPRKTRRKRTSSKRRNDSLSMKRRLLKRSTKRSGRRRRAAATSADDTKHPERMRAYQEEYEDLEAEDVFEGETDSGESVLDDGAGFGCETFRLSLIATDPSKGPDGPSHEGEDPPG
jgi:hypothetical protein